MDGTRMETTERSAAKITITKAQNRIYEVIVKSMLENGYVPSIRHICKLVGVKSPSAVHRNLAELNEKGLISIKEERITVPGIAMVDRRPFWLLRVV